MGDHLFVGKPPQYVTSHPGQLSLLPSVGWKWVPAKMWWCSATGSKTCMAHSIRGWTYGRQVKPSLTHAVPECLRDESIIKHYTTTTTTTTTTTITTTTTVLWPFVRDYPGEPVPEETLIHPPSWSSPNLYQLLPSTTIHSVLCSNWVLGNLFAQPPPTSSLVYLLVWSSPSHTPYISSPNQCLLFF